MRYRTRVVELARRGAREAAENRATVCVAAAGREERCDVRKLFVAHYQRIRATCLAFGEPGVAVFGFSLERSAWQGSMCLAARPGEARAGVVGRHSAADLFLDGEPELALRHLLYVLEPMPLRAALRGEVRFRVMDLETGNPPRDEEGRGVASLTAEGPVFLTCGGFALLAFVTGDPTDWPERAGDAWDCLPERIFVEERLADGSGPRRLPRAPAARSGRRTTVVRVHDGPSHIAALAADEPPHGVLLIATGGGRHQLRVGHQALRRGLLIGRYERCHGPRLLENGVSRVHLMIVELAGQPCAIDLGSSNGSFLLDGRDPMPLRAAPCGDGQRIGLAGATTVVAWRPA
jgi:hypothetical protein